MCFCSGKITTNFLPQIQIYCRLKLTKSKSDLKKNCIFVTENYQMHYSSFYHYRYETIYSCMAGHAGH